MHATSVFLALVVAVLAGYFRSELWDLGAPYTFTSTELTPKSLDLLSTRFELRPEDLAAFQASGFVILRGVVPLPVIQDLTTQLDTLPNLPEFMYNGKAQLASWYAWAFHRSCGQFTSQAQTCPD